MSELALRVTVELLDAATTPAYIRASSQMSVSTD